MNELTVKLLNADKLDANVYIDGKHVKLGKLENGVRSFAATSDAQSVELVVMRHFELGGSLWFLKSLLFFILGCFGIFDAHYANNIAFNIRLNVELKERTTVALRFNPLAVKGRAVEIVENDAAAVDEVGNNFYANRVIGKRKNIMSLVKLGVWLVLFALAIVLSLKSCGFI